MNQSLMSEIIAAINTLNIRPHSLRGQNFLVSGEVVADIIELNHAEPDLPRLEIGAGLASLSKELAKKHGQLDMIEIEPLFARRLQELFGERPQTTVHLADATLFDYQQLYQDKPYLIYANVPYNITTPLLKKLLLTGGNWQCMTLMLQKEAAERLVYANGKDNGPLPLLLQYMAESEISFLVPKEAFYPMPAVTSAIVHIKRRQEAKVDKELLQLYKFLEAAFSLRRKTLTNALAGSAYGGDRSYWEEQLQRADISTSARAESLSLSQFQQLFANTKR